MTLRMQTNLELIIISLNVKRLTQSLLVIHGLTHVQEMLTNYKPFINATLVNEWKATQASLKSVVTALTCNSIDCEQAIW